MTSLRQNAGFGLLEVLIAMLLIAVGLLGISALQMRATQAEMESYQRAQALLLLDDMANRMRANSAALSCYVLADSGIANLGTGTTFANTGCNARADADLSAWHDLLLGSAETLDSGATNVGAMVNARGCITYDAATDTYTVSVAWQGMSDTFAPTGNDCGIDEYGAETRRRVAATSFLIGSLI